MKDAPINEHLLADKLVDVVDNVRRKIHKALGTRQWDVAIVTRTWSGSERGVGTPTVRVMELDPPPQVSKNAKDRMGPAGREAVGSIVLTGVSLRYTEEELNPRVDGRTEVAYRMTEAHGQRQRTRWFVLAGTPVPRRDNGSDWYIVLNETSSMGGLDKENAP